MTLIAGGSRVGTLYGVYDLLHRMGCRWFSPAKFDEDLPRADWKPAFDVTGRPSFSVRGFYIYTHARHAGDVPVDGPQPAELVGRADGGQAARAQVGESSSPAGATTPPGSF